MTRASDRSAISHTLGPAGAAPTQLVNIVDLPPIVAVTPPPAGNANASLQANDLHATGQPANAPASAVIPSAAQNLTTQLLSVDPNMTINQLTGILNILAPNRHMRSVASNLLRSSQPEPRPPAAVSNGLGIAQPLPQPLPLSAPAPNQAPPSNPLTGARISIPQRRAQPQAQSSSVQDILDAVSTQSRKRSEGRPIYIFISHINTSGRYC